MTELGRGRSIRVFWGQREAVGERLGLRYACTMADDKEAQRAELERLTADYDGPVTRRKRDQRISMVCPACKARRMVSGLMFTIACRRCGSIMKPWWVR
jgi:hypothetical protein